MPNQVPVTFARHGQKQLLPRTSWGFAADWQAAALLVAEFPAAAHHLPIVFIRINDKFSPAALLGLAPGDNALVDADGRWRGEYIPAILRRQPFALLRKEKESNEYVLCVDEEAGMLADNGGEPLFTADGKPAAVLENALAFAQEHLKQAPAGEQLGALLSELNLLAPLQLKRKGDNTLNLLKGFWIVDEKRLNALPDDQFLRLRTGGVIHAIAAHLLSLAHIDRLDKIGR